MGLYQPTSLQHQRLQRPEQRAKPSQPHSTGAAGTATVGEDVNRLKVDHLRMKAVLPLYKALEVCML
ncbi:unnamed protein product [Lepidochelys olivacea]